MLLGFCVGFVSWTRPLETPWIAEINTRKLNLFHLIVQLILMKRAVNNENVSCKIAGLLSLFISFYFVFLNQTFLAEAHSQPCQTSKVKHFVKIRKMFRLRCLTGFRIRHWLKPWFDLWSFFIQRLCIISVNLSCNPVGVLTSNWCC